MGSEQDKVQMTFFPAMKTISGQRKTKNVTILRKGKEKIIEENNNYTIHYTSDPSSKQRVQSPV